MASKVYSKDKVLGTMELSAFDSNGELKESVNRKISKGIEPEGRLLAERLINSVFARFCFGSFSRDGRWHPNYQLEMTVEEQRQHNIEHGYLRPKGDG